MEKEYKFYPKSLAIFPDVILSRHEDILKKYGRDSFLKDSQFKKAREVYETALYALCLTAKFGTKYWVSPASEINETPDTYLVSNPEKNEKLLKIECVEVTTWEEHCNDFKFLIGKKAGKKYPPYYSILIHIERPGSFLQGDFFRDIHLQLKNCDIGAGAVRFWSSISGKGPRDILFGELYPDAYYTEFSIQHILNLYQPCTPKMFKISLDSFPKYFVFSEATLNVSLPGF